MWNVPTVAAFPQPYASYQRVGTTRYGDNGRDYFDDDNYRGTAHRKFFGAGICCCCCCTCLIVLYPIVGLIAGSFFVKSPTGWGWAEGLTACTKYWCGPTDGAVLTPQNLTRYLRWGGTEPAVGYKSNATLESQSCYSADQAYDMETFNRDAPYTLVRFPSRPDPEGVSPVVQIAAWAMKAKPGQRRLGAQTPRIVIQHGVGSNQNNRFVQYAAYQLRSMGFDVLTPGFRGHGWSEPGGHEATTWGWIYPMDLLGAWDYAVNDTDNIFGGSIEPSKVGIFGISLGAMTASTAFGMEQKIGAAWIDSGPADPKKELREQLSSVGILADLLLPIVYWGANWHAGVDLGRYTPSKSVPGSCAKVRPVAVVGSSKDSFVPLHEDNLILDLFASSPKCYNVDTTFFPPDNCNDMNHGYEMYLSPDMYRVKLCNFFTGAFKLQGGCDYCGLLELPWYNYLTIEERKTQISGSCSQRRV